MEKAPRNLSSASCPERFTPGKTVPGTHSTRKLGPFGSRSEFFGDETNVLPLLEIKPRFCDFLTAPRSLNQMNYSNSSNGCENYLQGGEQKLLFTKFCYAILFDPASQLSSSVQILAVSTPTFSIRISTSKQIQISTNKRDILELNPYILN